ncbi:MAG: Gp15 family bacteriophage protein [Angelakisella sp.]
MNPLAENLPIAIRLGEEIYPIRSDWRSCMKIILAFEDAELTEAEKLSVMTKLLYKKTPPLCGETFEKAVRFLNCGENDGDGRESTAAGRLYSFERDGRFIYPAFRQSHGIDLGTAHLHWWEFCWLFLDLREDCAFCRLVGLRERKRRGTLSREEREQMAGMERLLELPQSYSPEERTRLESFMESMKQS